MNILNFMQRFLDEASCIACLKEQREQSGIVCKYCVSVRNIVGMQQVCSALLPEQFKELQDIVLNKFREI